MPPTQTLLLSQSHSRDQQEQHVSAIAMDTVSAEESIASCPLKLLKNSRHVLTSSTSATSSDVPSFTSPAETSAALVKHATCSSPAAAVSSSPASSPVVLPSPSPSPSFPAPSASIPKDTTRTSCPPITIEPILVQEPPPPTLPLSYTPVSQRFQQVALVVETNDAHVTSRSSRSQSQEHPAQDAHRYVYYGDYELLQTLGKGEFGKVKLARHRHTSELVLLILLYFI